MYTGNSCERGDPSKKYFLIEFEEIIFLQNILTLLIAPGPLKKFLVKKTNSSQSLNQGHAKQNRKIMTFIR